MRVKHLILLVIAILCLLYAVYVGKYKHDEKISIAETSLGNNVNQGIIDKLDYSKIGFEIMEQESLDFLKYNTTDVEVQNNLGEPEEKSESTIWDADLLEHQTWRYKTKGIELNMVRQENGQVVKAIYIKSPCNFKTKKNIGIGSIKKEVINAYQGKINPENTNDTTSILIVGTVYGGIIFKFENDRVSSIFIGASSE